MKGKSEEENGERETIRKGINVCVCVCVLLGEREGEKEKDKKKEGKYVNERGGKCRNFPTREFFLE